MKNDILVITDPGIDDAVAIITASKLLKKRLICFVATFGNHHLVQTFTNLKKILEIGHFPYPFFAGSNSPFHKTFTPFTPVHGKYGLGSNCFKPIIIPSSYNFWTRRLLKNSISKNAYQTIANSAPNISIVSLAPLTDVSRIIKNSQLNQQIKQILIMGGCLYFPGNATLSVEANFFYDPQSVSDVFSSEFPIILFPLNLTEKIQINDSHLQQLNNSPTNNFIKKTLAHYINYYLKIKKYYLSPASFTPIPYQGAALHDICPVLYLKFPHIFKTVQVKIGVNPTSGEVFIVNSRGEQNTSNFKTITLVTEVDTKQLFSKLVEILNN